MKTVLCYGDSNTWGYDPIRGDRHIYEDRWTSVLQARLGNDFLVIPEGLNGRTTVWEDPVEGHKNGLTYLIPCLESHKPLDVIVLFLGTNDLKTRFSLTAWDIAAGAGTLVDIVKSSGCGPGGNPPNVFVIIPPQVQRLSNFKDMFKGSRETSREFSEVFKNMADEKGVSYIDIGKHVHLSDADGIHFEKDQLKILGSIIADEVRTVCE